MNLSYRQFHSIASRQLATVSSNLSTILKSKHINQTSKTQTVLIVCTIILLSTTLIMMDWIMKTISTLSTLATQRVFRSVAITLPPVIEGTTSAMAWNNVFGITTITTIVAGMSAIAIGFIDPIQDFQPPKSFFDYWKPLSAFIFPAFVEEICWRAILLPSPTPELLSSNPTFFYGIAFIVLIVHVLAHPPLSQLVYPRGRGVFSDPKFLFLAIIVLGGTTLSYIVSGGSVWAAVLTHGLPVALWRDFFSGEQRLQGMTTTKTAIIPTTTTADENKEEDKLLDEQ